MIRQFDVVKVVKIDPENNSGGAPESTVGMLGVAVEKGINKWGTYWNVVFIETVDGSNLWSYSENDLKVEIH